MASAGGYRQKIGETRRWLNLLVGPSLIGGTIGSLLVTRLPAKYFALLVPWLILLAASLLLADSVIPRRTPHGTEHDKHSPAQSSASWASSFWFRCTAVISERASAS